jgi:hypothetical protein
LTHKPVKISSTSWNHKTKHAPTKIKLNRTSSRRDPRRNEQDDAYQEWQSHPPPLSLSETAAHEGLADGLEIFWADLGWRHTESALRFHKQNN